MKSYFKIPLYLEVETTEVDRQKITDIFNKELLPCFLDFFKTEFSDFQELCDELELETKTVDQWKKKGILSVSVLDLQQHLEKVRNVKKS
jgi:hypothetical protein